MESNNRPPTLADRIKEGLAQRRRPLPSQAREHRSWDASVEWKRPHSIIDDRELRSLQYNPRLRRSQEAFDLSGQIASARRAFYVASLEAAKIWPDERVTAAATKRLRNLRLELWDIQEMERELQGLLATRPSRKGWQEAPRPSTSTRFKLSTVARYPQQDLTRVIEEDQRRKADEKRRRNRWRNADKEIWIQRLRAAEDPNAFLVRERIRKGGIPIELALAKSIVKSVASKKAVEAAQARFKAMGPGARMAPDPKPAREKEKKQKKQEGKKAGKGRKKK